MKALLAAHGHQFATVKPTYERIAATNAVKLVFNIDEGPTVKVGTITIVGNKAFSDRKIIRSMHNDRPYSIPLYITSIPVMAKTFDRPKLDEDMEVGIRGLYQDHGYFKVDVNVSDLKTVDLNRAGIPLAGTADWTKARQGDRHHDPDRRRRRSITWANSRSAAPTRTRGWCSSRTIWREYFH